MESLLPLKRSDARLLQDKAIELGCKASYLEKDYWLVHLVKCLQELRIDDGKFIFTGGTALAKGYKLIKRFSEDCDFIFQSPNESRSYLSRVKDRIKNHLQDHGFSLKDPASRNKNRNMAFEIEYPSRPSLSEGKNELRSELKLEIVCKKELRTPPHKSPVQSFLSESKKESPEVNGMDCLSIEEISTGKLSALVWRTLDKSKDHDPRLIRHLYDLGASSDHLSKSPSFRGLCRPVITDDLRKRARLPLELSMALEMIVTELRENPVHRENYRDYLLNFVYGPLSESSDHLSFENAVDKITLLLQSLEP